MTHDNKRKFWIFYTKDPNDESVYELYAFTDNKKLANEFKQTRCMDRFYLKIVKLDRMNYNELIRHHMMSELEYHEGVGKLDSTGAVKEYKLPVTKYENRRIMTDSSVILHERLYSYVWFNVNCLQDKYRDALWRLGYQQLQSYILHGDNMIHRSIEDSIMCNDINILLDVCGWSFVPERKEN